jgi:purine-nucleoside phosphorylase
LIAVTFNAKATAAFLRRKSTLRPTLAIVLGSGFQHGLGAFRVATEISFGDIPGFSPVGVTGHEGKLVFGRFEHQPALVLKGRAHFYEGYTFQQITFPIRALAEVGVTDLLLTNAAGGIHRRFRKGDFMALTDHINLMGDPLRGVASPGHPRFVDLTRVYDPDLHGMVKKAASKSGIRLHEGIYAAVSGPCYETPAEIRAYSRLGADAVGMSTVPEAIVARQCGVRVAAVSCITNLASGRTPGPIQHQHVLSAMAEKKDAVTEFLKQFALLYAKARES